MTNLIDLKNTITTSGVSFVAAARTATANGTGVDLRDAGALNTTHAVLLMGTVSGTTPTLDIKIQESDDNSSFSDITGATFTQQTATPTAPAGEIVILIKNRSKRYVRAVATIGGTTPSFTFAVWLFAQKRAV